MRTELLEALDIDRLLQGCWRFRWPGALAVCLAVSGLWYGLAIGPNWRQVDALSLEQQQLHSGLMAQQGLVAELPTMRARIQRLGDRLARAAVRLPKQPELAALLVDVSQAGVDAGLIFERFQPDESVSQALSGEHPIRLAVRGGYHQFGHFLEALAGLPRLVTLGDFEVSPLDRAPLGIKPSLRFEAMLMAHRDAGQVEALPAAVERISTHKAMGFSPTPVHYQIEGARDPFRWPRPVAEPEIEPAPVLVMSPPPRDLTRARQPLEGYPLDQLRLVGRLDGGSRRWALVRAPDGRVHVVQTGDFLGQDQGRVEAIRQDQVVLIERVADGAGDWRDRKAHLELQP